MEYLMTRLGADALRKKIAALEEKLRAVLKEKGYAAEVGGNQWHDNFSFEEAQRQEQMLVFEIRRAQEVLSCARVVEIPQNPTAIHLGCTATVAIHGRGTRAITIVGYGEADPDHGRIAYNSPMGQSLLGARAGETRSYRVGNRQFEVTVLEICSGRAYSEEGSKSNGGGRK